MKESKFHAIQVFRSYTKNTGSDRCKESLQKRKDTSLKEIQQRIFLRADERSKIRIAFESTLPH